MYAGDAGHARRQGPQGPWRLHRANDDTALKTWLARHPAPSLESFLFCDREGWPLKYRHLVPDPVADDHRQHRYNGCRTPSQGLRADAVSVTVVLSADGVEDRIREPGRKKGRGDIPAAVCLPPL
jgi:hypothetical protein